MMGNVVTSRRRNRTGAVGLTQGELEELIDRWDAAFRPADIPITEHPPTCAIPVEIELGEVDEPVVAYACYRCRRVWHDVPATVRAHGLYALPDDCRATPVYSDLPALGLPPCPPELVEQIERGHIIPRGYITAFCDARLITCRHRLPHLCRIIPDPDNQWFWFGVPTGALWTLFRRLRGDAEA